MTTSGIQFRDVPRRIQANAPLFGSVTGLHPGSCCQLSCSFRDELGQSWGSTGQAVASETGEINLATAFEDPTGRFTRDSYRLYTSMALSNPNPDAVSYFDSATEGLQDLETSLSAMAQDGEETTRSIERTFLVNCERQEWRDELCANLFVPRSTEPTRPVLVISGSNGGFAWCNQVAAFLASAGRAALAIAYFDWMGRFGLPKQLAHIPIELFETALDRLRTHPQIRYEDVSVVAYSRGTEAAFLIAAERPEVRQIVAFAPSAYVWSAASLDPFDQSNPSWTRHGRPVPFVPLQLDQGFFDQFGKTRLRPYHDRALADASVPTEARVPIPRPGTRLLLLTGDQDSVWPATSMAAEIMAYVPRQDVELLSFKRAGHFFLPCGLPASTLDGEECENAAANRISWGVMRRFLGVHRRRAALQEVLQ